MEPPKEQGTGFCIIEFDGTVSELGLISTDEEILDLAVNEAWIGIDASLVVPSDKKLRKCEHQLRSRGLRVLPTNLEFYKKHYGGCRGERLASLIQARGFEFFGTGSRVLFEVYPFAVFQMLFPGAKATYKRGSLASRRLASEDLLRRILEWEPRVQLPPKLMGSLVEGTGAADRMDAFMAAVLLYRHGISSGSLSEVVGDRDDGYILLPRGASRNDR